jgi:hypothetical protein
LRVGIRSASMAHGYAKHFIAPLIALVVFASAIPSRAETPKNCPAEGTFVSEGSSGTFEFFVWHLQEQAKSITGNLEYLVWNGDATLPTRERVPVTGQRNGDAIAVTLPDVPGGTPHHAIGQIICFPASRRNASGAMLQFHATSPPQVQQYLFVKMTQDVLDQVESATQQTHANPSMQAPHDPSPDFPVAGLRNFVGAISR